MMFAHPGGGIEFTGATFDPSLGYYIINNPDIYAEMVQKSGQPLSPCVEVDGIMLTDVSGEEVEDYLLSNKLVNPSEEIIGVPTNAACSDEEHAEMNSKTIRFF